MTAILALKNFNNNQPLYTYKRNIG